MSDTSRSFGRSETRERYATLSEAEKLLANLARYKLALKNLSRVMKPLILWSSIALFYVVGGLSINLARISTDADGILTPWGVPVIGITEPKFLIFLIIMTIYYAIKFGFPAAKIIIAVNPFPLFRELLAYRKARKKNFVTKDEFEDYKKYRQVYDFETASKNVEEDAMLASYDGNSRKWPDWENPDDHDDLRQFMVRRPIFGWLETFFAPLIFPFVLSGLALVSLVCKMVF